ncbi:uncharacterized protein LOC103791176 isoform X2 [Callithrix jacchus]
MLQAAAFSSAPTGQNKTSQLSTSQDVPGILITKAVGALWIPSTEQHSPEDRGSSPESISNRTVLIEIYTGDSQEGIKGKAADTYPVRKDWLDSWDSEGQVSSTRCLPDRPATSPEERELPSLRQPLVWEGRFTTEPGI